MAKDSGTLIGLGIAAAVGYYGYTQGWFSSLFGSAATTPAGSGAPAPGGAGAPSASQTVGAPPASQPSYSGASLDQMFQLLQEAVQAAYGSDPALTCGGMAGFGLVPGSGSTQASTSPVIGRVGYQENPNPGGMALRPIGVVGGRDPAPASSCANPLATYDVFNWYLTNRAGVSSAPNPPDHTSVVSLTAYWAWAAPLLKQMNPGLAGGFNSGLGGYAELGMILERQAGGF